MGAMLARPAYAPRRRLDGDVDARAGVLVRKFPAQPSPRPEDAFLGATDPRAGRLGRNPRRGSISLNENRPAVNRAACLRRCVSER